MERLDQNSGQHEQRPLHRAPISASTAELRRAIPLIVLEHCEWRLSVGAEGNQQQDIKQFWGAVLAKAELPAVRIHELPKTFPSLHVSVS